MGSSTRCTGFGTGLPSLVRTRACLMGSRSCIRPAWTWMLLEKQTPTRRPRPSTMMHSLLMMLPFRVNSHSSSLQVLALVCRAPRALLLLKAPLLARALPPPHQPSHRSVPQSFQQVLLLLPQLDHQRVYPFIHQLQVLPPFLQSTYSIPQLLFRQRYQLTRLVLLQCLRLIHRVHQPCSRLNCQARL